MVVLGIDPGLERVGLGIVRREGSRLHLVEMRLVKTPRVSTPERLLQIHREVTEALATYRPDHVAHEKLFFAKNHTTAMDVAKALGVIQLAAAESGLACQEFSPPEIKLAVVGNGAAEKRQVQFMVQRLLGLAEPPKSDDVADALAAAITLALRGAPTSAGQPVTLKP